MTGITHHIPDSMLLAYASGTLAHPFAMVVAAHVSMCTECAARLAAHQAAGGCLIEDASETEISTQLKSRVFDQLDAAPTIPAAPKGSGIFPGPVMQALDGMPPKWKLIGLGVRQSILHSSAEGSVRLLYIPGGQAVPDHGHNGLELTLVLQGAFRDETGRFGAGDVEVADDDLEHTPIAEAGPACICLAATDASLRFKSFVPRMLQPLLRI